MLQLRTEPALQGPFELVLLLLNALWRLESACCMIVHSLCESCP